MKAVHVGQAGKRVREERLAAARRVIETIKELGVDSRRRGKDTPIGLAHGTVAGRSAILCSGGVAGGKNADRKQGGVYERLLRCGGQ